VIAAAENLAKKEIKDLKAYVNSGGKILLAGRAEKCLLDMDAAAVKHIELAEDWTEYVDSGYTSRISLLPEAGKFLTALKEIAGDKQFFEINAPGYVVSEVRKTKNGTLLLHLLNYKNTDMAKGVKVRVNPAWIPEKRRCELLNPDHKTKELTGTLGNETLNYNIPPFKTYCILKFSEDCHA
jgi:hypothetical protein